MPNSKKDDKEMPGSINPLNGTQNHDPHYPKAVASDQNAFSSAEASCSKSSAAMAMDSSNEHALKPASRTNNQDWDPEYSKNVYVGKPSEPCFIRVRRDILIFHNDPPPGIFIEPHECDMTLIHILITGPIETPYEGGFFYFIFRFPNNYPMYPPMVKLLTTDGNRVRFNPNMYRNGKVCLSLLRTWSGPDWSPCLTLSNILLSIQSLMSEKPYHNEPGFETEHNQGDAERYNEIILHETLRVAVCGMLEGITGGSSLPPSLREVMEKTFHEFYDHYQSTAQSKVYLDGTPMQDPFGSKRGIFNYSSILKRLKALKDKLDQKRNKPQESHEI